MSVIMGQILNIYEKNRVPYNEEEHNGLMIGNLYIPVELLGNILYFVDHKTLLSCQLVCKCWNELLMTYIWRKKAEKIVKHPLPVDENMHWTLYYSLCAKNPFEKNLIKNHSGKERTKNWNIIAPNRNTMFESYENWIVECPPVGVPPLPEVPVFERDSNCFVTSYFVCSKGQDIDLVNEGLPPYVLDNIQPPIEVSEWFSCRWDCPAVYNLSVDLINEANLDEGNVNRHFNFSKTLKDEAQNVWLNVTHTFTHYGKGVRKVRFIHSGKDKRGWAGHYGSKMAGACVKVKLPKME